MTQYRLLVAALLAAFALTACGEKTATTETKTEVKTEGAAPAAQAPAAPAEQAPAAAPAAPAQK